MKRFFAIALTIMMISALLCACGSNNGSTVNSNEPITTTVAEKYDDGYAERFATSVSTDENGNKVYEFTGTQYKDFISSYEKDLVHEITQILIDHHDKAYGEYVYIKEDAQSIMIGIHGSEYDEATAADEAAEIAEYGFKYFQNVQNPSATVKVVYCDANDQNKVYGSFEFTAE